MNEYPKRGYAYYVTTVLLFAYSVSFIDRQILSLLVDPIKADLHINDTEMSLLHGFAFAIFYSTLGLVFGRLADSKNRRNVMIAGVVIWSLATAAGGLATGFFTLFLARVFVGAGEAGLSPSAFSILTDYFPPSSRGRALSIYSMGVYLGSALAFIVGGTVVQMTKNGTAWQTVLFLVSTPGFLVALLMLTIREPVRRREVVEHADFSYLRAHKRVFGLLILGYSTISIVTLGLMAWVPAFFMRSWNWTPREIGVTYGLILLSVGPFGMLLAGFLADRLVARGRENGAFWISFWGSLALIPSALLLFFAASPDSALLAIGLVTFFLTFPIALAPAVYQTITPNALRGQLIAFYLLANTLLGMSLGPTSVAFISNYILHDEKRVGLSLSIVCLGASTLGVIFLTMAARPYNSHLHASRNR